MSGPNPQDPDSPLYVVVNTQPLDTYPCQLDSSPSNFTTRQFTPTAITKTKPIVVTIASHGFSNGNAIRSTKFIRMPFASATGMEQLNNRQFIVQQATTDTFHLYESNGLAVDGTNYTTYVSGGQFTLAYNTPLIVNPASFPPAGIV